MTKHFKAPQSDGGMLEVPPRSEYERLIAINRVRLSQLPGSVEGLSWPEFRRLARTDLSPQDAERPLIVAGHQPEIYHPGVWVKNFVLHAQSKRLGTSALNLIVDNDTFKIRSLMLPVCSQNPQQVSLDTIPFDTSEPEVPYEEAYPRDWSTLERWPDVANKITKEWPYEPMYATLWPRMVACLKTGASYARASVEIRQTMEKRWGGGTPELAVSEMATTNSFRMFARSLMSDAARFASVYNSAIIDYRIANGIRSKNHPAPELQIEGDLIESPFWTWRSDAPTRQRVFVRRNSDLLEIYAGLAHRIGEISIRTRSEKSLQDLFAEFGWKLRPRALTLTLFSRLAVGDLFIHGIGGGKYDEVTDEIIRRYFRIEPPDYAVISATIRLPLERFASNDHDLSETQRLIRDSQWNPQYFDVAQSQPNLVAERVRLISNEPNRKADRRAWYRRLADNVRELRKATHSQFELASSRLQRVAQELAANQKLARRDFSWILYPEDYLAKVYQSVLND